MARGRHSAIGIIAVALILCCEGTGHALQSAAEWIEALRPIHRGPAYKPPPGLDRGVTAEDEAIRVPGETDAPPAVAILEFEARKATLTPRARTNLDHLTAALASPELRGYAFEIRWYAASKETDSVGRSLAEQRAREMVAYVQAQPGITPNRVMPRAIAEKPAELAADPPPDALMVKIVNLGRED